MQLKNLTLLFIGLMIVATLSACGGGGEQGDGSQGGKGSGGGKTGGNQPKTQTLEGRVARADLDKNRVVMRPEEGEPVAMVLRTEGDAATEISLDGEDASPEDIESGQQAKVEYRVVKKEDKDKERNIALSIQLTAAKGGGTNAQESTGS